MYEDYDAIDWFLHWGIRAVLVLAVATLVWALIFAK